MDQPPQYPQQSMRMERAGSPQVMPQMQVNNNIQYNMAAGPSGTSTIMSNQLPPNQQMNIVAQDALGLETTASGKSSYTPSIGTVPQIKYKKLPFYEVIDEVIKPTLLTGTDRRTLPNVPEGMKEATFKVVLSPEHANFVVMNRKKSHGRYEYLYQFQIRICQFIEPVPNESPDYMPLGLRIRVNMIECQLPPTYTRSENFTTNRLAFRRSAGPIDCTDNVKLCPYVDNEITINWIPDGKNYVFAMDLVKKLTSETLIMKLQDKNRRSSEETKNYIIKKLAEVDPDIATTSSYRFSLVCPLGRMRMNMPAKSIHCDHLQCFDAAIYILMNEKRPTWMCPTCNRSCTYDDLKIQNYFLEVVTSQKLTAFTTEIEILPDGTWRVVK